MLRMQGNRKVNKVHPSGAVCLYRRDSMALSCPILFAGLCKPLPHVRAGLPVPASPPPFRFRQVSHLQPRSWYWLCNSSFLLSFRPTIVPTHGAFNGRTPAEYTVPVTRKKHIALARAWNREERKMKTHHNSQSSLSAAGGGVLQKVVRRRRCVMVKM